MMAFKAFRLCSRSFSHINALPQRPSCISLSPSLSPFRYRFRHPSPSLIPFPIRLYTSEQQYHEKDIGDGAKENDLLKEDLEIANYLTIEEVESYFQRAKGEVLTLEEYHSFMRAFLRRGHSLRVAALLEQLRSQGLKPTEETYTLVFQALGSQMPPPLAEISDLWERIKLEGLPLQTIQFFLEWMRPYVRLNDTSQMDRIDQERKRHRVKGNDEWFYLRISSAAKNNSEEVLWRAVGELFHSRERVSFRIWRTLLTFASSRKDLGALQSLRVELADRGEDSNPLIQKVLLESYLQVGDEMGAVQMIRQFQDSVPRGTVANLIELLGRKGRVDEALDLFERLPTWGIPRDTEIYTSLLQVFRSHRPKEEVLRVWKQMHQLNVKPNSSSYSVLVDLFVREDDLLRAESLVKEAEQKLTGAEGVGPLGVDLYNHLLNGYARLGNPTALLEIVERMHNHGVRPNTSTGNILIHAFKVLSSLSHLLKKLRDFPNAWKVFRELRAPNSLSFRLAMDLTGWEGSTDSRLLGLWDALPTWGIPIAEGHVTASLTACLRDTNPRTAALLLLRTPQWLVRHARLFLLTLEEHHNPLSSSSSSPSPSSSSSSSPSSSSSSSSASSSSVSSFSSFRNLRWSEAAAKLQEQLQGLADEAVLPTPLKESLERILPSR